MKVKEATMENNFTCGICKKTKEKTNTEPMIISITWPLSWMCPETETVSIVNENEKKICCKSCNANYVIPARLFLKQLLDNKH